MYVVAALLAIKKVDFTVIKSFRIHVNSLALVIIN